MSKISAGSYDLNKWLYGGYETDIVTVFYGASGTGKTNFCLLTAVSQARKGNNVIFIDTEGGFSTERVKQLAGEDFEKVLNHIFLLKPTSFEEQKKSFEQLLTYLKKEVSLIIVDGITILYRLDYSSAREQNIEAIQKINSELVKQMRILSEISRKREIPVLVTSQMYSWENSSRIVGGDILKYWSKCHIELTNQNNRRIAYLRKHRSLAEKELEFVITNTDIKKKGWL